jgi:hypothetical protein
MLAAGVSWADKIRGTEPEALAAVQLCVTNGLDLNTATEKATRLFMELTARSGHGQEPERSGRRLIDSSGAREHRQTAAAVAGDFSGLYREDRESIKLKPITAKSRATIIAIPGRAVEMLTRATMKTRDDQRFYQSYNGGGRSSRLGGSGLFAALRPRFYIGPSCN